MIGLAGSVACLLLAERVMFALGFLSNGRPPSLAEVVSWTLWTATMAAIVAPLWRQAANPNGGGIEQAALGLIAALPLCAGMGLLWQNVIEPLLGPLVSSDERFQAALLVPASLLLIGFGASLVIQALRGDQGSRPALAQAAGLAMVGWAAVGLYLIFDLATGSTAKPGIGEVLAFGYGLFTAIAWVVALRSVRQMPAGGVIGTVAVLVLLDVAMLVSVAIPAGVMSQSDGWDALAAVLVLPFAVVGAALTAFTIPPICRRLLGTRSPEPAWNPHNEVEG